MKVYAVGGAVRDALLGLPVQDHDYVVVGATPEQMVELGYKPVGQDFPVFLHPKTHAEYALARTERKTARGYKGFQVYAAPDVTLEEDLMRRDLTINAMAQDGDGALVDPFGGEADLRSGLLRHVSAAFAEDPVRILRVARFAARFENFRVASDTVALMRDMVAQGEVDALVPERVWQELSKGLMERSPSRMFAVLRECGALAAILPELDKLFGVPQPLEYHPEGDTGVHAMMVVDYAARQGYPLAVRFAALTHDLGKGETARKDWPKHHGHEERSADLVRKVADRLRAPAAVRDLALLCARHHGGIHRAAELKASTMVRLFGQADAFRRPQRFAELLLACSCDYHGRLGFEDRPYPQQARLLGALQAASGIDSAAIAAAAGPSSVAIAERIHQARIEAVRDYLAREDKIGH
jgi:tRNA nucleotidyltransferase (CCA-adding enzyme)